MNKYTHANFLLLKKAYKLKNRDIAEITGTTEQNVKQQLNKDKKLPTWAKSMLFMWFKEQEKQNPAV